MKCNGKKERRKRMEGEKKRRKKMKKRKLIEIACFT
jgi:hypothetical protein